MRIKSIQLTWFRGAADPVALEPNCKSLVVYGSNGSGKSCFVDAIEYVLNDGRIEHLAHEYSGRRQEKAIPNTHTPANRNTSLSITFKDDSEHKVDIAKDGSAISRTAKAAAMPTWDYRRTVLRQHEVAAFIQSTKGDKYSALLPLLGLHPMELAAENLRRLAKSVEEQVKLAATKVKLEEIEAKRKEIFGSATDQQILTTIERLHAKHCPDQAATTDPIARCKELKAAIDTRISASSAEQRRYIALRDMAALDLKGHIDSVRTASAKLADTVEPLITEKLEVLQSAVTFVGKLVGEKEVNCPACGQSIPVDAFRAHLEAERERLREVIDTFNARRAAIGTLCNTVRSLQDTLGKSDLKSWREELAKGPLAKNLDYLDGIDTETLRTSCSEDQLKALEDNLQPLIEIAAFASKDAPPEVQELSTDKQTVDVAITILEAKKLAVGVQRAETLIDFIRSLEQSVRDEIRAQAEKVISDISKDIERMWAILHPGEPIDNVRLCLPDDADKAIDIALKFHGKDQDSPRLTLSEGHRNSLGLCIFLALASREATNDQPVFLDDVVVSFDREHRGMIAEILEKEFNTRQMIILTHDRDWYTDLRTHLDGKSWCFKTLLPYETPDVGIRWSHKATTFDDARALLRDRPDAAGKDARTIMDVELAMVAEKLKSEFPFLRGEKNDRRLAHDFLIRLVADGAKCFQRKSGADYATFQEGIDALADADKLIVSWANRATHTTDITRAEASKLIDTCEKALDVFKCASCGRQLWRTHEESSKWVQCHCGELRWRYGKA